MVDDIFSINGKVVIITGGGRGLGHNLANGLATRSAITYSLDKKFTNKFQKNLLRFFLGPVKYMRLIIDTLVKFK